jgi:hypothetical protein
LRLENTDAKDTDIDSTHECGSAAE